MAAPLLVVRPLSPRLAAEAAAPAQAHRHQGVVTGGEARPGEAQEQPALVVAIPA